MPSEVQTEAAKIIRLVMTYRSARQTRDATEAGIRLGEDTGRALIAAAHAETAAAEALQNLTDEQLEAALRLLAQQQSCAAPAETEGLWLGDKDGLSAAGLTHALSLIPKTRRAQEAEVFCNGEPVTGVSILGKHGQSMGEFQVYLQTEGQACAETDIQIYPPPALAAADAEVQP